MFKITRLLQVVRSLRIVRFIGALRALVSSVIDTTRQLVWALILLVLVIYSFAILFTDACQDHMFRVGHDEVMSEHFGSVYSSCTTLFQSILAGMDWKAAADSLLPLGIFWVQLFNLYIAFCGFAVLNVMTGVFDSRLHEAVCLVLRTVSLTLSQRSLFTLRSTVLSRHVRRTTKPCCVLETKQS